MPEVIEQIELHASNEGAFAYTTMMMFGDPTPVLQAAQHAQQVCPLQAKHLSVIHDPE